jgi:hypothetical protein
MKGPDISALYSALPGTDHQGLLKDLSKKKEIENVVNDQCSHLKNFLNCPAPVN